MAVTLSEIARQTGLSRQTVAFILGDRPHLFREETREKVFAAAERLGYRRNAAAAAMASGRYNAIGLLQTSKRPFGIVHPNILAALLEELRAAEMHLSLGEVDDATLTDESAMPELLNAWAVDGLIISYVAGAPEGLSEILQRYRLPAIWANAQRPFDAVYPDDYGGVREATRRLVELGHRDIGFVRYRDPPHYSAEARYKGYADALLAAGLHPRRLGTDIPSGSPSSSERLRAISGDVVQWLAGDRPSAILIDDDEIAPMIVHQCALQRIQVGPDISVMQVSRDLNAPLGQRIAIAKVPTGDIGHAAVPLLLKKIESPTTLLPSVAVPYRFTELESSCRRVGT